MKRIFLLFTLLVIISTHILAKSFYYKGVAFEYKKGNITGVGNGITSVTVTGQIESEILSISATKLKEEDNYPDAVNTHLDKVRTEVEEAEMGKVHFERFTEIEEGTLNGIEGHQFDIMYKKKSIRIYQRIFCYIQDGWLVSLTFTGVGKEFNAKKKFDPILKSFSFIPE